MRFKRMFTSIDTHTEGEPTRTIIGGIPHIPGDSVSDKMLYMRDNMDWIRQLLMYEPRGNEVMSGVVLTEPCTPGADIGVIYIEVGGYLPMCGHDTIGVATALIESGMIEPSEPVTTITLDTPAGLVQVKVQVKDNVAREVTFDNVPSFLFARDREIETEFGKTKVDIAYGGNFYVIVPADEFGLELIPQKATQIIEIGNRIKKAANEQVKIYHPEKSFIDEATHVMFTGKPVKKGSDTKNTVVIPPGAIDRSPCGTGTSARLAASYARGELGIGESLAFESIINTTFRGKILSEVTVGEFKAVVPEITGRAYVTGINQWVLDPEDPIAGFLLR